MLSSKFLYSDDDTDRLSRRHDVISDHSKLRLVGELILDAQERPQTSQEKLAAFKYVPVFF